MTITGHERAPRKISRPVPMCEEWKRRGKRQRRGSEEKWCADWAWQRKCIIQRVTLCAVRPCSSVPCLDRCSAWLCCHSSPLTKGTRDDGKARWRHRQVKLAKSSAQGDGKVIALIKWLWLVSGAFVNHYPSAIVSRVNHNKPVRGDNQEAPLLIIVPQSCEEDNGQKTGSYSCFSLLTAVSRQLDGWYFLIMQTSRDRREWK